jgi:hypothetical protein
MRKLLHAWGAIFGLYCNNCIKMNVMEDVGKNLSTSYLPKYISLSEVTLLNE